MNDQQTTLAELVEMIRDFVSERDWQQFHSPKNLSMALTIEAGELMEHFQWISIEESRAVRDHPDKLAAVSEEIADVFAYTLAIAGELQIDLAETLAKKMVKNREKYPVAEFKGRYGKEDVAAD
jgi:NTP pyrophosphatase (non-canonical NTP hydrolase)